MGERGGGGDIVGQVTCLKKITEIVCLEEKNIYVTCFNYWNEITYTTVIQLIATLFSISITISCRCSILSANILRKCCVVVQKDMIAVLSH